MTDLTKSPMVSYAQNYEDVMLWRALQNITSGFYIDVGAHHPVWDSVTKVFYENAWSGINIEPITEWFEELSKDRPNDINLQLAVGAEQGEMTLYEIPNSGLSTFDKAMAERHEHERACKKNERKVSLRTITDICEEHKVETVHFLKIDVEGAEKQVLEGIDFTKIRPWIILLEAVLPNSQIECHASWEPTLLAENYEYVYFDGLNRFYVAKEHSYLKESFNIPPNIFDCFVGFKEAEAIKRAEQAECYLLQANARADHVEASLKQVLQNSSSSLLAFKLRKLVKRFVSGGKRG